MKRYLIIVLISIVSVTMLSANKIVKIHSGNSNYEIKKRDNNVLIVSPSYRYNNRDTADTLQYVPADGGWNAAFVQSPGDAMFTTFQVPANVTIKAINVPIYEWGTGDQQLTISLHKLSYPYDADGAMYPSSAVDGAGWIGGYDMDSNGHMSIEGTTYSPGGTQGVCDDGDFVVAGAHDPLGTEAAASGPPGTPKMGLLWPLGFTAATMDPTNHPDIANDDNDANWTNLSDYGDEVDLLQGDWIGVMVASTGAGGGDDDATGFLFESGSGVVDPWVSAKFYAGCGGTSDNGGWHIRSYMFNFQLAVVLTSDRGPIFTSVTKLPTTISTDARTVTVGLTDDNPIGGDVGVSSAVLSYRVDSLTATINTVAMSLVSGDAESGTWEAVIPGQVAGSFVYWSVKATDVNDNATSLAIKGYYVFAPTPGNDLIYNNQYPLYGTIAYASYLYFYWGGAPFDIWDASYGGIVDELTEHYSTIVELTGNGGPAFFSEDEIIAWWGGGKTFIAAGDEYLGSWYGWTDGIDLDNGVATAAGELPHDVLGVATYYADISGWDNGGDGTSRLKVVSGDAVLSSLEGFLSDSLTLDYDPNYETEQNNWMDGIEALDGVTLAMEVYAGVLNTNGNVADETLKTGAMVYHQAGNGGKSAFLAFDPISLNTGHDSYHWVGASYYWNVLEEVAACPTDASPLIAVYEYLDDIVGVEDDVATPNAFSLKGNYPNPFNPITNITFNLDVRSDVTVTVYSLLGEEVATIHNSAMQPGLQSVQWNGLNSQGVQVASGVYIYRVEAHNRALTGKMMLLK